MKTNEADILIALGCALPEQRRAFGIPAEFGQRCSLQCQGNFDYQIGLWQDVACFQDNSSGRRICYLSRWKKHRVCPSWTWTNAQWGQLYLLSISTGKIRRLIYAPVYNKWEVYAYPDFSPNGNQVVFAIHSQLGAVPSDGDDAVMDAGPFAILDLRTGVVKKLPATVRIDGYGAAYGASPRWSPNGERIFVNLESDFALTTPSGEHLQDTSGWTTGEDDTFAVNWLGNGCVVYIGGKDWKAAEDEPAKVLLLGTHKTEPLNKLLDVAPAQVTNLVALSPTIRVRHVGAKLVIETQSGTWSVADPDEHPNVRIFSTGTDAQVPVVCR